jgi:Fic family protein
MEERLDARLLELPPAALHELTGRISGIDEFRGWWQGRGHACPSVLTRLQERTIEVSSDISARNASRASLSPPRDRPWGQRRVGGTGSGVSATRAGHAELLRSVFRGYSDMEFGQDLILRFHSQLFRYSAAHRAHRGRYKEVPDRSPAYVRGGMESPALRPTEPHLVPREMEILVHWTTARLGSPAFHPLLVIASFLLEVLAIRPFADGNRRMSRILAGFLLLQHGYAHVPYLSLDAIVADREMDYSLALRRAQAKRNTLDPDIMGWLRAFLDVLQTHALELRSLLEGRPREDHLSGNQQAVLSLLDRHGEVSIRLVRRELGIPRDTAKQVLARLHEWNLVRRMGAGRAARYLRTPLLPGEEPLS